MRTAQVTAPDWPAVEAETLAHLQALIRLNTVNPPGNELAAAQYLADCFRREGISAQLFEPTPGRGAIVARLRGNGSARPVIIMGHLDVVGVEAEHWTVDPFSGAVRDGYLIGRGAIDDKGMVAANLMTMLLLQRHVVSAGGTLSRDVIFVANADEEAGGEWGMGWLLAQHPELLEAEVALNEGGRTRIVAGKPLYVAVQNTEKVPHVVTVTARGPGGHAAIPLEGNAITRLGRALAVIGAHREPLTLTPTTQQFFGALAAVWPEPEVAGAMAELASGDVARAVRGDAVLSRTPVFNAVLRAGVSPVLLGGGIRSNVIPTDAIATLNIRTLPEQSVVDVVARLEAAVGDPLVTFSITEHGEDAPVSDFRSPMFEALREAAALLDPDMVVVPYLSTGATDSARLRQLGMQAFGVLPFPMTQDDEDRMHGNDERVPLASLAFGTRLIYEAIVRVAG